MLGANGVVLPLGRLLLRGCKEHAVGGTQAAACAAWALANILYSCPSEVCCPQRDFQAHVYAKHTPAGCVQIPPLRHAGRSSDNAD